MHDLSFQHNQPIIYSLASQHVYFTKLAPRSSSFLAKSYWCDLGVAIVKKIVPTCFTCTYTSATFSIIGHIWGAWISTIGVHQFNLIFTSGCKNLYSFHLIAMSQAIMTMTRFTLKKLGAGIDGHKTRRRHCYYVSPNKTRNFLIVWTYLDLCSLSAPAELAKGLKLLPHASVPLICT